MPERPILLPEATTFDEVLTYDGEWDYKTMTHDRSARPSAPKIGQNVIGPFGTVDLSQIGGERHRSIVARPTEAALTALRGRIVTEDDTLSFRLIAHAASGKVLVIAEHGYIIGSHWLAYIDPETIPAAPTTEG